MLAEKHTKDQNFVLIVQQFLSALEQEGVTKIKTIGEEFNPHTMEAVSTSEGEGGKVIEEARAGYMFYDSVLRPAQVVVGA
jgi:molecular chaperone GrpE